MPDDDHRNNGIHNNSSSSINIRNASPSTNSTNSINSTNSSIAVIRVAFIGDSLTSGWGLRNARDDAYPSMLARDMGQMGVEVDIVNHGEAGMLSASATRAVQRAMSSWPRPHVVVMALGTNDGLDRIDIATIRRNLVDAVRLATRSGATVVMAGMRVPAGDTPDATDVAYVSDFQAMWPEVAGHDGTMLVPFLLEGVGGRRGMNLADGVHPNEAGHVRMAANVMPYLRHAVRRWHTG